MIKQCCICDQPYTVPKYVKYAEKIHCCKKCYEYGENGRL